jgi:hypothetical protein
MAENVYPRDREESPADLIAINAMFVALMRAHHPDLDLCPAPVVVIEPEPEPEPEPPPVVVAPVVVMPTRPFRSAPNGHEIMRMVCKFYNIQENEFLSKRRSESLVSPRRVMALLCSEFTKLSLVGISRIMDRDHTTILHALRKIRRLLPQDEGLQDDVEVLRQQIIERWKLVCCVASNSKGAAHERTDNRLPEQAQA